MRDFWILFLKAFKIYIPLEKMHNAKKKIKWAIHKSGETSFILKLVTGGYHQNSSWNFTKGYQCFSKPQTWFSFPLFSSTVINSNLDFCSKWQNEYYKTIISKRFYFLPSLVRRVSGFLSTIFNQNLKKYCIKNSY